MSQPLFESNRSTRLAWIDSLVALAAGIVLLTIFCQVFGILAMHPDGFLVPPICAN